MYVYQRFILDKGTKTEIRSLKPEFGFDGFGEIVFYRTYSRLKANGYNENWADCVIRVIEGIFSIRKDWYIKNHIEWVNSYWQNYAHDCAISMFNMEWLPPGRGLWMCGTEYVYTKGSMPLYSCSYVEIGDRLDEDLCWAMDCLMCGVGVGFTPVRNDEFRLNAGIGPIFDYEIEDSREGWVESQKLLLKSFLYPGNKSPRFNYDKVRPKGCRINGFGGVASGPEPLQRLHDQTRYFCQRFIREKGYDTVMLKTDLMNIIGYIVTSGGVRRSAELALQSIKDPVFKDLKDYKKYPYRINFGWMSNNTVTLLEDSDFESLDEVARRVQVNGEPGIANLRNFPFGRIGKEPIKFDQAQGLNPCGEILLENKELCNICETFPTRGKNFLKAIEFATFYCSTVTLLPTHQPETNKIIARNRRIGVGIVDFVKWRTENGVNKITKICRDGYEIIRNTNRLLANEAGVPESIRVTTVKPGGSVPKLAGCTSGTMYPNFRWMIRRIRVQQGTSIDNVLIEAGIPYEPDFYSENTNVFEYPMFCGSRTVKTVEEVTLWEQAMNVVLLQREWADNAVSNTLMYKPAWVLVNDYKGTELILELSKYVRFYTAVDIVKTDKQSEIILEPSLDDGSLKRLKIVINREKYYLSIYEYDPKNEENDIEPVLSAIAPLVKNITILPHSAKGVYKQMPEEGITEEEYKKRLAAIKSIDWEKFRGEEDIETDKFCSSERCEIITQ